jgi:hypothetical protein
MLATDCTFTVSGQEQTNQKHWDFNNIHHSQCMQSVSMRVGEKCTNVTVIGPAIQW